MDSYEFISPVQYTQGRAIEWHKKGTITNIFNIKCQHAMEWKHISLGSRNISLKHKEGGNLSVVLTSRYMHIILKTLAMSQNKGQRWCEVEICER